MNAMAVYQRDIDPDGNHGKWERCDIVAKGTKYMTNEIDTPQEFIDVHNYLHGSGDLGHHYKIVLLGSYIGIPAGRVPFIETFKSTDITSPDNLRDLLGYDPEEMMHIKRRLENKGVNNDN